MNPENVTLGLALLAGLVSFISPCVLPLVPAYIGYMGGRVTNTVSSQLAATGGGQAAVRPAATRFSILLHGLFFVAGFSFVFVVTGLLITVFVQEIGGRQNVDLVTDIIGRLGGVLIILFGLHFMGLLPRLFARLQARPSLLGSPVVSAVLALLGSVLILWGFTGTLQPSLTQIIATTAGETKLFLWPTLLALVLLAAYLLWLALGGAFTQPQTFWMKVVTAIQTAFYADTRRQMTSHNQQGYSGSAIMGVIFAAGWTPCIGPIYGSVLTLALNTGDVGRAGPLLIAYSLGLGIPFLLTALLLDSAQGLLRRLQRHMPKIELVSGAFLVLIGLLVASNSLQDLSQSLNQQYADFSYDLEESVIGAFSGEPQAVTPEPTAAPEGGASSNTGQAGSQLAADSANPAVQLKTIEGAAAQASPLVGTGVGDLAPDFETATASGQSVKLSDLRGQIVLINFWATWCGPCRAEMPEFEAVYKARQADGFTILAVNNQETLADVTGFRQEFGLTFPVLLDEQGAVQRLYGIQQYPSTFLLDRNGVIIAQQFGPLTAEKIQRLVDSALSASTS